MSGNQVHATLTLTIAPTSVANQMLVTGRLAVETADHGVYEVAGTYYVKRQVVSAACRPATGSSFYEVVVDGRPTPDGLSATVTVKAKDATPPQPSTLALKRKGS